MHAPNQPRHNRNQETFRRAITEPDGTLRPLTRIEIEPLSAREFRWTLWSGEEELFTCEGDLPGLAAMLQSTGLLLRCAMVQLGHGPSFRAE